jgi:hypothetical protein
MEENQYKLLKMGLEYLSLPEDDPRAQARKAALISVKEELEKLQDIHDQMTETNILSTRIQTKLYCDTDKECILLKQKLAKNNIRSLLLQRQVVAWLKKLPRLLLSCLMVFDDSSNLLPVPFLAEVMEMRTLLQNLTRVLFPVASTITAYLPKSSSAVYQELNTLIWQTIGLLDNVAPSDKRLKKNLVQDGEMIPGLPIYRFEWNELAWKTYRLSGHGRGVLAQDVQRIYPDLVYVSYFFLLGEMVIFLCFLLDIQIIMVSYEFTTLNWKRESWDSDCHDRFVHEVFYSDNDLLIPTINCDTLDRVINGVVYNTKIVFIVKLVK